jgi:SAM-dependent methyltransferase
MATERSNDDDVARRLLWQQLREIPPFRALVRSVEGALLREMTTLHTPVLDLGCGDGDFAATSCEGNIFAGLDPDHRALESAAARRAYQNLVRARAEEIPLADGRMGTVMAVSVCEHIADVDRVIQEAHRVLKPGGQFVLSVPTPHFADMLLGSTLCRLVGFDSLGRSYGAWFNRLSRHVHIDAPEVWCDRLRSAGFRSVSERQFLTPAAMRAFDLCHYLSVPMLVTWRLTGRWVLWPALAVNRLHYLWLRRWAVTAPVDKGPYVMIVARKDG